MDEKNERSEVTFKMKRIYKPQPTKFGNSNGRDAIYMEEVSFQNRTNTLILDVEFNTSLCSNATDENVEFVGAKIVFYEVLATKIIELDSWDWESESSFDEVEDSEWIKELGGKVKDSNKHYLIQTYDDVIEVVCENYEIKYHENS